MSNRVKSASSTRKVKGKTRSTANFDPKELETFKTELEQPTIKPAFESRQIATEPQQQTGKLTHNAGEITTFDEIGVIDKLSGIIESLLGKGDSQPLVPIADKLLLTIAEVQALTGLSRQFPFGLRSLISR